jgi:hypothetical protein
MSDCSCTGAYPCVGCEADGWPVNPEHLVAYGSPIELPPLVARPVSGVAGSRRARTTVTDTLGRVLTVRRGSPPVKPDGVVALVRHAPYRDITDRRSTHQGQRKHG